jgi:ankyrin repeat protein
LCAVHADIVRGNAKDALGNTAPILAFTNGHREIVEFLVAGGADVNGKDGNGKNLLMLASDKRGYWKLQS